MDYHHHQQANFYNPADNQVPSSNEKALMWSQTQYMTESGYSTQAPSICSIDSSTCSYQTKQDNTIQDTESTSSTTKQPETNNDNNAVANWMNYQDNSEMALKAIPELLKLLQDEDLVVVREASIFFNNMVKIEGPRIALIQTTNAVQCLVDCLNTTADLDTARCLCGALYGVSTQKTIGPEAIINSKALDPLIKMLSVPVELIVSYSITTLHNVLLICPDKVKMQMRKMGAIHQIVPLLNQTQNPKFLSIGVDCLYLLSVGCTEAKQLLLELNGTQIIVNLLHNQCQYQKLLLNLVRLLKVLSCCPQNKQVLISLNCMQALSMHMANNANGQSSQYSQDILQACLVVLRNLSDSATRVNGLEQVVQNLVNFLSTTNNFTSSSVAAGVLSNLTCNNENNKKAALRANGVNILLKVIQTNMHGAKPTQTQLIEPAICTLRHITNRHSDMLLAQEQVRSVNGLNLIIQLMSQQPRVWPCVKALLGLVRNFCSNQLNATQLRTNCVIEKLMQILYDAYTEINSRTNNGASLVGSSSQIVKVEDVNLLDIVDLSSAALLLLAKDYPNQIIMKELDCIGFFVQMFYSPVLNIQKAAVSILAELAANKDCAEVIEQQAGLQQFVQANFCNQFGVLKTIAELSAANSNASIVLQHVTTLMQRLQEHKNSLHIRANNTSASYPQFDNFNQQQQQQMYYNQTQVVYNQSAQTSAQVNAPTAQSQQQFANFY